MTDIASALGFGLCMSLFFFLGSVLPFFFLHLRDNREEIRKSLRRAFITAQRRARWLKEDYLPIDRLAMARSSFHSTFAWCDKHIRASDEMIMHLVGMLRNNFIGARRRAEILNHGWKSEHLQELLKGAEVLARDRPLVLKPQRWWVA
jgi:hypothetical protein